MNAEERRQKIADFLEEVDWDSYDYTAHAGADMAFPDFSPEQMAEAMIWPSKHYNTTSEWNCVHVADLNQIGDGQERRFLAMYGIPVSWPSRTEDEDGLNDLLDELDSAREDGGDTWAEAMDSHGLLGDEHYEWLRNRSLGIPEALGEYGRAKRAVAAIDAALEADDADDLLSEHGFRDAAHFTWFKRRVERAGAEAWAAMGQVLSETHKQLDERFEKNKEALEDELAPYKGLSMEDWAGANAALAQGQPLEGILAQLGMERPLWDDVNAEWNGRMSRDTTATIATVYGQAFTGAGAGRFGAAAKAVSSSMKAGHGNTVKGEDPISFEDWIKIQAHMSAASSQGIDPNAVLAKYQLTSGDWGAAGGYWALKMNSDPMTYLTDYQTLSAKYAQQFASGSAGSDIEF